MNNINIGISDLIKELGINRNSVEFTNDLNIFLNVVAFDESEGTYYDIIKYKFNEYMGKWNLDVNKNFFIISKYIKARKLPYKIAKDEGFEMVKSEKFIISMLVELYAMNIIINNDNVLKEDINKFIYYQFKDNGINVSEKDIVLTDLDYLFKDKKLTLICKENLKNNELEINKALNKMIDIIEKRKNIKLKLQNKLNKNEKCNREKSNKTIKVENQDLLNKENTDLRKYINKLKKEVEKKNNIIDEYVNKEIVLKDEINKLEKDNIQLISYGQEQYSKALIDLVKNMNDDVNGNLLDRLYCYSKGKDEKNLMFVTTNLFNVFRQMGISPREKIKIGENVSIEEYSFYNYRLNKDISDVKLCEGEVLYPAWFYNSREILKPYVNIKGE